MKVSHIRRESVSISSFVLMPGGGQPLVNGIKLKPKVLTERRHLDGQWSGGDIATPS